MNGAREGRRGGGQIAWVFWGGRSSMAHRVEEEHAAREEGAHRERRTRAGEGDSAYERAAGRRHRRAAHEVEGAVGGAAAEVSARHRVPDPSARQRREREVKQSRRERILGRRQRRELEEGAHTVQVGHCCECEEAHEWQHEEAHADAPRHRRPVNQPCAVHREQHSTLSVHLFVHLSSEDAKNEKRCEGSIESHGSFEGVGGEEPPFFRGRDRGNRKSYLRARRRQVQAASGALSQARRGGRVCRVRYVDVVGWSLFCLVRANRMSEKNFFSLVIHRIAQGRNVKDVLLPQRTSPHPLYSIVTQSRLKSCARYTFSISTLFPARSRATIRAHIRSHERRPTVGMQEMFRRVAWTSLVLAVVGAAPIDPQVRVPRCWLSAAVPRIATPALPGPGAASRTAFAAAKHVQISRLAAPLRFHRRLRLHRRPRIGTARRRLVNC